MGNRNTAANGSLRREQNTSGSPASSTNPVSEGRPFGVAAQGNGEHDPASRITDAVESLAADWKRFIDAQMSMAVRK